MFMFLYKQHVNNPNLYEALIYRTWLHGGEQMERRNQTQFLVEGGETSRGYRPGGLVVSLLIIFIVLPWQFFCAGPVTGSCMDCSRAVHSGPSLIVAGGIATRSQVLCCVLILAESIANNKLLNIFYTCLPTSLVDWLFRFPTQKTLARQILYLGGYHCQIAE